MAISQGIAQPPITKINLKIIHKKIRSNLPGDNELIISDGQGLISLIIFT